jgi:cyanophycinase-like exopeptidase
MTSTAGPVALVGSGEYLPVMTEVERLLIAGRPPRYVQIPTAAAPEGEESVASWVALGVAQAERLAVEAVPVVVRDRADADSAELAAQIKGAGLIYLSGGNPPYLARTLRGTRVWEAIAAAWSAGAALAGCSAGAMALSSWVPDIRQAEAEPDPGLGVVPDLRVIPHFDRLLQWMPDLVDRYLDVLPSDVRLVGIDEETALIGESGVWTVHGRQSVWLITPEGKEPYTAGQVLPG